MLFRAPQSLIQQVAKVGLDHIELALGDRDGLGKIVENGQSNGLAGADWAHNVGLPTTSGGNTGLPVGTTDVPTLQVAQIGARNRVAPHCGGHASVRLPARIVVTRDQGRLAGPMEMGPTRPKNWSSLQYKESGQSG
jgi:hypothetical protein